MLATQQLTEFLSVVADRPGGPAAQHAAVECAARALGADVALLMIDGAVAAAFGIPAGEVPAYAIGEVVAGRRTELDLRGRRYAVTVAAIGSKPAGQLVLGRPGEPFDAEEVCLLRGLARVLELSLRAMHTTESEQRYARENDRLLDFLNRRQRMFEQLTDVQRAIARRAPLDQVFQAVAGGLSALLEVDVCSLNMIDRDDRTRGSSVASIGLLPDMIAAAQHQPLASSISGLSILGDELIAVADYAASPIIMPTMQRRGLGAVMAAPVHENGVVVGSLTVGSLRGPKDWDKPDQEALQAYAEHVSLALTEARTLEAMSQSFRDSLTGLATRALFLTRMEGALAIGGLAVLFIDLDRFKVINDSLGHAAGDRLLVGVAARVRACLRDQDTAARLGADEFAVLLPGIATAGGAVRVAERILRSLRDPFELGAGESFVSTSIGVAVSGPGEHAAQDLMVHADLAVGQAKRQGKDRVEVFVPAMRESFQATVALEADLRRAVVRHEFELRYQPIVHLRTKEITGVEALIRWRHPSLGMVSPLDFIPLAEETGLIVPIGEWVLREACARVAEWNRRRDGRQLSVSVNLSAVQLDQSNLIRVVCSALEESRLASGCLVLELTESLVADHRPETLHRLEAIKALGVRLAIDDFGTGYSSLAYLRRFPVDILKIDKSFVDDVVDEPTAAALAHGIIQLGQALQLSTVAEGIEHADQLNSLTVGNCELGQGYYFAEPLTDTALDELLFPESPN